MVMAVVAEKLTIKNTDEFDRFTVTGNRNAAREGLYIATGDSVTAGSSITFAADSGFTSTESIFQQVPQVIPQSMRRSANLRA